MCYPPVYIHFMSFIFLGVRPQSFKLPSFGLTHAILSWLISYHSLMLCIPAPLDFSLSSCWCCILCLEYLLSFCSSPFFTNGLLLILQNPVQVSLSLISLPWYQLRYLCNILYKTLSLSLRLWLDITILIWLLSVFPTIT